MTIMWLKSFWQDDRHLRRCLLLVGVSLIVFWLYSIAYIIGHPAEKGSDGFEIFLAIPMTGITLFLSLPALLLLISDRTLRISAFVTLAAVIMNVWLGNLVLWHSGLGRAIFWPIW